MMSKTTLASGSSSVTHIATETERQERTPPTWKAAMVSNLKEVVQKISLTIPVQGSLERYIGHSKEVCDQRDEGKHGEGESLRNSVQVFC